MAVEQQPLQHDAATGPGTAAGGVGRADRDGDEAGRGEGSLEYCFQVPANRIGNLAGHPAGQLKIVQEVITLVVFAIFSATYLGQKLTWNYYVAFGFIGLAVFFVFHKW